MTSDLLWYLQGYHVSFGQIDDDFLAVSDGLMCFRPTIGPWLKQVLDSELLNNLELAECPQTTFNRVLSALLVITPQGNFS